MKKRKNYCEVCGQHISMRTVGHTDKLELCWMHDVEIRKLYGNKYHSLTSVVLVKEPKK